MVRGGGRCEEKEWEQKTPIDSGVHVIIPCYKAYDSLTHVIPNTMKRFPPCQIWIAENGHQDLQTVELCHKLGVHYRYYPTPSKTLAMVSIALELDKTDVHTVVLLDDDTELPESFFIRNDLLQQPLVAGYAVAIGIRRTPPFNVWESCIDLEYRTISHRNGCRSKNGTIPFIHGICAVYHLRRFLMIYTKLCVLPGGLPFGEDAFAGIDFRLAGYQLKQDNENMVYTYCPRRFLPVCTNAREQGFGASSLWKQRVMRWYLSWPRRLPAEVGSGFFYDAGNWVGNLRYRWDMMVYVLIMVLSSGWVLYLVRLVVETVLSRGDMTPWKDVGLLHGVLVGSSWVTSGMRVMAFNPLLRRGLHWSSVLFAPLMNAAVAFMMGCSFLLSILWYIPFRRVDYDRCYANAL